MRPLIEVPANKLHLADGVGTDQLALVEMLCIGQHAVARSEAEAGDYAVILGAGPIGMSVLQFLRLRTKRIVVVDLDAARLFSDFDRPPEQETDREPQPGPGDASPRVRYPPRLTECQQ